MTRDGKPVAAGLRAIHRDIGMFSDAVMTGRGLRRYQRPFANAVAGSVRDGRAMELAAVFSRQSGKDEALAQICAFLLSRYRLRGGSVVVALPALRPQGMIARDRLLGRLRNPLTAGSVRVRDGTTIEVGKASVRYLSASRAANSRGNTASLLLVGNEAQDIEPDVWDAVFAPMAASSNATTLFMGTVWSSDTLLARQMRTLREMERVDAEQRVFMVPWRTVAEELPPYGEYVQRQMAQLGETHPFIQTEYELAEIDHDGRLFPPERVASMEGNYSAIERPAACDPPGSVYAFTIDVAGEVEDGAEGAAARRAQPRRDSTALNVVRVVPDDAGPGQRYEIVARYLWTGTQHTRLHDRIATLATRIWNVQQIVIDATGVGAGLASFLRASLGERVVTPFTFSATSKSRLAWDLLGLLESDRLTCFDPDRGADAEQMRLHHLFWEQVRACRYSVLPGPGKLIRWEVGDDAIHDDLLIATALITVLDRIDLRPRTARAVHETQQA